MAAINTRFKIKQNDLLPPLKGQFRDEASGEPQDLTGATLQFHMADARTGVVKVNQPAVIDGDPTLGRFKYDWQTGNTDTAGLFHGEIQATIGGKPITGPNSRNFTILITPEIA